MFVWYSCSCYDMIATSYYCSWYELYVEFGGNNIVKAIVFARKYVKSQNIFDYSLLDVIFKYLLWAIRLQGKTTADLSYSYERCLSFEQPSIWKLKVERLETGSETCTVQSGKWQTSFVYILPILCLNKYFWKKKILIAVQAISYGAGDRSHSS